MGCPKRSYNSENLALNALMEARIKFDSNSATNVYQCDECGSWHLTSRGTPHPRLATALKNGSLKRQKEVEFWERKLR